MLALIGFAQTVSADEYAIDPAETTVSFEVRNFGLSSQRGSFNSVAGIVMLNAEEGSGRIDIAVDTRSVRTGNETTERFLRGPGVLNVEQYSEMAYRAGNVVFEAGKPMRIDGELTLLGVTRPVPLAVKSYACAESAMRARKRCTLDAVAVFKRSEFGMTGYRTVVSDDVKLAIHGVGQQ